jgi:uncharacterized membrane protein YjfL (UPF0719 family)
MTDIPLVNALIFAATGVIVLLVAIGLLIKTSPVDLRRQIVEDRNIPVAIVTAAAVLALGWIVAATMH